MNLRSIKGRVEKIIKAIKPGRPPCFAVAFRYPDEWLLDGAAVSEDELAALERAQFEEALERYRGRHPGHDPLEAPMVIVSLAREAE